MSLKKFNKKKNAFSVAEAMIALLIGSIALGMAAPMITKQIKQEHFAFAEKQVMTRQIEKAVPSGAIMYFDLDKCPNGWEELTVKYPKSANAFIRNKSGSERSLGDWQQNAAPNITGAISTTDEYKYYINENNKEDYYGAFEKEKTNSNNSHKYEVAGTRGEGGSKYIFDASKSNDAYGRKDSNNIAATEIRPDNITFLACRKK